MIDSIIINLLRNDTIVASKVTKFAGKPAIFSDVVPEKAKFPNITVRAMQVSSNAAIKIFNIYIDYWDYSQTSSSRETSKFVANRIEFILDGYVSNNDRYSDVRFRFISGYSATAAEYDGIHYNLFFGARGTRKEWMAN